MQLITHTHWGRRLRLLAAMGALAAMAVIAPSSASAASLVKSFGFPGPAGLYAYGMDWDKSDNTILVSDYWNYRVKRYTTDGVYIGTVSKPDPLGTGSGIGAPYDVEADQIGNPSAAPLWVADQGNSRIVEFSHTGTFIRSIGKNGHGTGGHAYPVGCGNGAMTIPTHIFADPVSSQLYVSDPRCRQVYIFNHTTGAYVGSFHWPGGFTPIPRGIAGDASGIYVVEHNTRSIYEFNRSGTLVKKLATNSAMNDPRGLDMGGGSIYVVSAIKNTVYQYSESSGALIRSWGHTGGGTSGPAFDSIRFPAVDGNGNVYVGDTWGCPAYNGPACTGKDPGYRVYKYTSSGQPVSLSARACTWSLSGTCDLGSTQPPPTGRVQPAERHRDQPGRRLVVRGRHVRAARAEAQHGQHMHERLQLPGLGAPVRGAIGRRYRYRGRRLPARAHVRRRQGLDRRQQQRRAGLDAGRHQHQPAGSVRPPVRVTGQVARPVLGRRAGTARAGRSRLRHRLCGMPAAGVR